MKRLFLAGVALIALVSQASAQSRQPAQITTLPTTAPQEFDLLDKAGNWTPFGTIDPSTHWWSSYGAPGMNVRAAGCKSDGTDQTACIQNALNAAPDCVMIPASTLGFSIANPPVIVSKCLQGSVFNPNNAATGPAGSSFLWCNNQVAQPCVVASRSGNGATKIGDISILGSGATPVAGSMGLQWQSGYNLILNNIQVANFDTCAKYGPPAGGGNGPISLKAFGTFISRCKSHYHYNDGIPELYFIGGRWGENGGADYASADDFIYSTKSVDSGVGGGPNGLVVLGMQINPGGATVGCAFRWGGFAASTGAFGGNKFIGNHVEIAATYTGSKSRGLFCVDSTVPTMPALYASDNDFTDATKLMPPFNIDPAVPFNADIRFVNNSICANGFNLTLHNVVGQHSPYFAGNYICQVGTPNSLTAGDATAAATMQGNSYGNITITGQFANLVLTGNIGTLIDAAASGNVFESGAALRLWTPSLTFGGAAAGMAFTSAGTYSRTASGGYIATASLTLTAKGTSTGVAHLEGLPLGCSAVSAAVPTTLAGMTGLTGAMTFQLAAGAGNNYAYAAQSTAAGYAPLTDTSFTNTTTVGVTFNCGKAL